MADVLSPVALDRALISAAPATVVHLAADMDFYPSSEARLTETNVAGTRNLLDACAARFAGRKIRLVYVSSTEAVGEVCGGAASEGHPCAPDSAYGASKLAAEAVVLDERYVGKVDVIVLRSTGVYGVGENFFFREVVDAVSAGLMFVRPGPLDGRLMVTEVGDVVSAIVLAAGGKGGDGERLFHICPDQALSYRRIVEVIAEEVGRAPPRFGVPLRAAQVVVRALGGLLNWGKRRPFLMKADSLARTRTDRVYKNALAKRVLGWKPRFSSTEEGIREYLRAEIALGSLRKEPVSPLALNVGKMVSFIIFVCARLSMGELKGGVESVGA